MHVKYVLNVECCASTGRLPSVRARTFGVSEEEEEEEEEEKEEGGCVNMRGETGEVAGGGQRMNTK